MKKTNRIISIVLCFAMLISAFSMLASAADIEATVENQSFENMTVGEAPDVDGWNTANTGNGAQTAIGTTETYPNMAANISHYWSGTAVIKAVHSFSATNKATMSFDYKYESMSPNSVNGGADIGFGVGDTLSVYLRIQKADSTNASDDYARLLYRDGGGQKETGLNTLKKNEWYNFTLTVDGAKSTVTVKQNGAELFTATYDNTASADVSQIILSNRTWDPADSHFVDNIQLTAGGYTYNEDFEDYAHNKTIGSDDWTIIQSYGNYDHDNGVTTCYIRAKKSPITKQVSEETIHQNRAMNVKHAYGNAGKLTVKHSFDTATEAELSFDYRYTSMSPAKGGGGGASLFLAKDGTDKFGLRIFKTGTDQTNSTDKLGEVYYNVESSSTKSGFANLVKGEWYHFDLKISPDANGSKLELKISYDGAVVCEKTITTSTALEVNQIYFSNRSWDPDDSHWIDNISLTAGDYSFNEDFEDYELNKNVASDVWSLSCPDTSWAIDRDDVNVRVQDASYATRAPQLSNKALNINHTYMHQAAINTTYSVNSTSKATLTFDYLYDSISPNYNGGKGGALMGFGLDSAVTYYLAVYKLDENWTADTPDYDKNAKLYYYNGSKLVDTGFTGLTKGEWYTITLDLNGNKSTITVKQDGKIIFNSTVDNGVEKSINKIYFANRTWDPSDIHWIDNLNFVSDTQTYSNDFDSLAEGAIPEGWTNSASNSSTVFIKVVGKPLSLVEPNKALLVQDSSEKLGPVRATRSFDEADGVTVEFDYMLASDGLFEANCFKLYGGSETDNASKVLVGVFPNTDLDGVYTGTGTLKYYSISGWVDTAKKDIAPGEWYRIKIELTGGGRTAKLYFDNEKIADLWVRNSVATVDRFSVETGSVEGKGELFYIDNLNIKTIITEKPAEFADDISSATEIPADYVTTGNVALVDGTLSLNGDGSVNRTLSAGAYSGEFKLSLKTDSLDNTAQIILTEDGAERFVFRIREDGALEFKRPTHYGDVWRLINTMLTDENGNKYPKGQIKANAWAEITLLLPYDRNNDYVYVSVNGEYVGDGLFYADFASIDGFGVSSLSSDTNITVKNFAYAYDTEGVIKMPERTEEAATTYLPMVINGSKAMYLENDTAPATGKLSYATADTSVQFNKQYNSIGVDLGRKQSVNALRISTEAVSEDVIKACDIRNYIAWQSDDNVTYTQVKGITYNHLYENGKWVSLIEFSGVEARYIKINYQTTVGQDTPITVNPLGNIRPEVQIARQYKMAGDFVTVPNIDRDPTHTSLARVFDKTQSLTITTGMSIGLNFGTHSEVEAVELIGNGLSELGADAFEVYVSDDNCYYTKIDKVTLSRDVRDGKDVYRLSFDSVDCVYIKLHAVEDGISVELDTISDGFAAYSSVEADSYYYRYHYYRGGEGCFFTLPDGTVIMVYLGCTDGTHDYSTYKMLATASLDGGYTWSDSWVFLDMPKDALSVSSGKVIYLDEEQETLGLVYRVIREREDGNGYLADVYFARSYDLGKNWEDPVKLVTDIFPDTYGGGTSGNSITRLSNGRIMYSYTVYEYQHDDWGHSSNTYFREYITAYVFYSDDEGITWTRADSAIILSQNADEPSIAELDNGDLLLTLRTRDENAVYQSISTDNGNTWAQPVAVNGMDTPSSTNTIVTIPATGDVMIVWNNHPYDPTNGNGIRNPLTAAISADHGLTYSNVRNIFEYDGSSWANIHFYGRKVFISNGGMTFIRIHDIAQFYHTVSGVKTVADLSKAQTPVAVYDKETGWLTDVSANMTYSLDGGASWKFCGGTSVLLDKNLGEILVKDIGTSETAPSDIQTISEPLLSASAANLSSGAYLYLEENHVMHNKTLKLSFDADSLADGAIIRLGHGETAYGGSMIEITNKTISAYNYLVTKGQTLIDTEHGLDILGRVELTVRAANGTATAVIRIGDKVFVTDSFSWNGRNGKIFAKSESATIKNVTLTWSSSEYNKEIWLMGDSYFSAVSEARWPYYLYSDGYTGNFFMGFPGRASVGALNDFKNALKYGTPEYAVWCMGMNDRDSETAVNASWLSCYNEFISICNEKGITPILATIPNTPATSDDPGRIHTFKNDIIRKSGYRYIDFATAVDANEVGSGWAEGMLSGDTVHPDVLGAKALYAQVLKDFPEIKGN